MSSLVSDVIDPFNFLLFLLRIEKLEKETRLIIKCRKNGWTNECEELEEYEKMLEDERNAESGSFLALEFIYPLM